MKNRFRALLASAVLLATPTALAAQNPASLTADLDGDGRPESITLRWTEDDSRFTLQVAGASLQVKTDNGANFEVQVVDLDKGDKWKELVVSAYGEVDSDHHVYFLGYDGKTLRRLGDVHAFDREKNSGNGIVLSDTWQGFWTRRDKYVLDRKEWKLREVPQEFYSVGAEATVKQTFPITFERSPKATPVANLAKDSRIQVLLVSPSTQKGQPAYFLVKSTTGLLGWTTLSELEQKTEGLPFAG
ncbi:hypothetical protein [Melittangium boletus]|uniref:S9 family peptidase n=1 Tax=Melittangium boletus DSM 14713 TaxID=1294270 RepID=A0A250IHW6_9BACT|nr:hypothetical protein [Melittangium boletus]ATB30762.1 hypothetical protein MEBOL_004224 [Melittangium boletus DSM 14713]